jgi:hypothetical protein
MLSVEREGEVSQLQSSEGEARPTGNHKSWAIRTTSRSFERDSTPPIGIDGNPRLLKNAHCPRNELGAPCTADFVPMLA